MRKLPDVDFTINRGFLLLLFLIYPAALLRGRWWSRRGLRDRVESEERQGRHEVRCQARSVVKDTTYKWCHVQDIKGCTLMMPARFSQKLIPNIYTSPKSIINTF